MKSIIGSIFASNPISLFVEHGRDEASKPRGSKTDATAEIDAVDALNDEVCRQIVNARDKGAQRPEHYEANRHAGSGVYKKRSWALVSLFVFLATFCAFGTSSFFVTATCAGLMYLYIDFYGGLLHYVLDEPANMHVPLIGEGCLEFQWHHNIPYDISSQSFGNVVGALNSLQAVKWSTTLLIGGLLFKNSPGELRLLMTLLGWGSLFAIVGQWSHRQAHMPKHKRSSLAIICQESGLIISANEHNAHHKAAFDAPHKPGFAQTYPILNGYSGPLLEMYLETVPSPKMWTAVWFFLTIFDLNLIVLLCGSVARVLGIV